MFGCEASVTVATVVAKIREEDRGYTFNPMKYKIKLTIAVDHAQAIHH